MDIKMSKEKESDSEAALSNFKMTQDMIDITERQLIGLRTQCSTTEEITQKEIREVEAKLINLFSKQLVSKAKLKRDVLPEKLEAYPRTEQWLKIVGLNTEAVEGILNRNLKLEGLLEMREEEVLNLSSCGVSEIDILKLNTALQKLKVWTDKLKSGDKSGNSDIELHWTSYKSASNSPHGGSSPKLHHQRPSTSSLPAEAPQSPATPPTPPQSTPASPLVCKDKLHRFTPPPTPPPNKPTPTKGRFPTTPPPQKKNKLCPDVFHPLTKSKSHESQLAIRVNTETDKTHVKKRTSNAGLAGSTDTIFIRRKSAESDTAGSTRGHSGQTSPLISSPKKLPGFKSPDQSIFADEIHPVKKNQLSVPMSPLSVSMSHSIAHRFEKKIIMANCDLCNKFLFNGKQCKECKMKFHKECAAKAAPSCGLPNEFVEYYIGSIQEGSPHNVRKPANHTQSLPSNGNMMRPASSVPAFQVPDSSSNTSSCNSSTPSSPAPYNSMRTPPSTPNPSPCIQITANSNSFQYPDLDNNLVMTSETGIGLSFEDSSIPSGDLDFVNTNASNDSDKSDKTLIDSGASLSEKSALLDRADDDLDDPLLHRNNSISITLKEWDIPYEELKIGEQIGTGRFGTVCKGTWHGDVAIKMLNMDPDTDNPSQLQAFKLEVAMLRKTRHENLVLFMGACMRPPNLAIVTSLCKGRTLYQTVHERKEKFNINKIVIVASQIAQGMGYLHAKSIVHKDLKSKNIFLESGKVVITDFGLFNATKLCHGNRKGEWLSIPPGWLCYLSPEIMQALQAGNQQDMDLPFTDYSDVYAFGTVWYELLCGEWPFKNQPPEAIIWQVGKGIKQSLGNLHASRDVKDVLMLCWAYNPKDRTDFSQLLKTLDKLPKKRLARSPSHPIQLSRSAESVF